MQKRSSFDSSEVKNRHIHFNPVHEAYLASSSSQEIFLMFAAAGRGFSPLFGVLAMIRLSLKLTFVTTKTKILMGWVGLPVQLLNKGFFKLA